MKVKERLLGSEIEYAYDTGDGQRCLSRMPAAVAGEIASKAARAERDGSEVVVDGRYRFSASAFDGAPRAQKRKG